MITEHEPAGRRALPPLSDKHRHTHEVGSAIAPDILDNSGVHTITDGRQLPRGFSRRQRGRVPGVLYEVPRPNGKKAWVFRPDDPDPDNPGLKYEATCKELGGPGNVLYVHPSQRHLIGDTSVPVMFVEGIKKALSIITAARAAGVEVLVVGILGVWNWMADGKTISDMFDIPVDSRDVGIVYDADMLTNPSVQGGCKGLAELQIDRGATVRVAFLPSETKGADDFFAAGKIYPELLMTMRTYDPGDFERVRLTRDETLRALLEDLERQHASADTGQPLAATLTRTFTWRLWHAPGSMASSTQRGAGSKHHGGRLASRQRSPARARSVRAYPGWKREASSTATTKAAKRASRVLSCSARV